MLRTLVLFALTLALAYGQRAGDVGISEKDGLAYVRIPAGKFTMGCSASDTECDDDEKPAHEVEITKAFLMGQTPVTVGAWKRFAAANMPDAPKSGTRELNPGWAADDQPIVNVTWSEAAAFCKWAGKRLPTEAEFEYAARAGTSGARYGELDAVAWSANNSGNAPLDATAIWNSDQSNFAKRLNANGNAPRPVATKQPNSWKLYDMLGNVYEWTADLYHEEYYSLRERRDPRGPARGEDRVMRGGSWNDVPANVRASYRSGNDPDDRGINMGFRCAGE